ncbi:MAG: hypothetical protein F4X98_08745 [Gammaproteobacteria bacterium]|nr:hypothetical protein [Gammaproteobacteria bacterium]
MWSHDTRCKTYLKCGLGAAFGIALCSIAHGQTAELLSVQPATVKDGAVEVYGIVRGLGDHPFEDGAVLAVQVTAAESDASTALRQNAGGKPCPDCTTTHYFLVRKPGEEQPKLLTRTAPGPVTYIHIDGKEYMLGGVGLSWTDDGVPRLGRATLLQTGFAPPLFKRRLSVRFDAPLDSRPLADDVARMAMSDAMERDRIAQRAYEQAVQRHAQTKDE